MVTKYGFYTLVYRKFNFARDLRCSANCVWCFIFKIMLEQLKKTVKVHFVEIADFWISFSTRQYLTNWETQLIGEPKLWGGGGPKLLIQNVSI